MKHEDLASAAPRWLVVSSEKVPGRPERVDESEIETEVVLFDLIGRVSKGLKPNSSAYGYAVSSQRGVKIEATALS